MAGQKKRRWMGGYVRIGKNGRPTFVIDRWIRGVHFHLSTRCSQEKAALAQLARFEADPYNFSPLSESADAVRITEDLLTEFGTFMRDEKKDSREWIRSVLNYLAQWGEVLAHKDLRALNVQRDLLPPLAKWKTSRRHRVEAIKSFCTWLRRHKGLLHAGNDATQNLPIPKTVAEKLSRPKVVSEEHVRRVLPLLPDETRDVAILQLGTAWHLSEVRRFAADGEITPRVGGPLLAVLTVKHKNGELVSQPVVAQEHLDAARRIKARGRIPIPWTLAKNMREACDQIRREQAIADVPEKDWMPHWRLGQLRHTVLTWAYARGASAEDLAKFAHHATPVTTRKFYLDLGVPSVSIPVLRLLPPDDDKGTG